MRKCKQCSKDIAHKKSTALFCNKSCKYLYYRKHSKEKIKEYNKRYYKERPHYKKRPPRIKLPKHIIKERHTKYLKEYAQTFRGRLNSYKKGAKARSLTFELTEKQFKTFWKQPCFYCGDEIKTVGLDRMDSNIGYSMDNVVACCSVCNKMKMCLSANKFIKQCKKVAVSRKVPI